VAGPLIPFITIPELTLLNHHVLHVAGHAVDVGPFSIKPFGALVALGVYLGLSLVQRYAKQRGFTADAMSRFVFWIMVISFTSGHVLDTIFYHPEHIAEDPLSLLKIWDGLSSFGGFAGGIIGSFAFKHRFGLRKVLPFADTMAAAFPFGWVFGRMGCSVVHDHPGLRSDLWFAVQYPQGGRFDLGLYEMLFAILVAVGALLAARRPRPAGFFLGYIMLTYAPTRFAFDFLRAAPGELVGADPRYLMLTPAQWACIATAVGGFYFLYKAASSGGSGYDDYTEAMAEYSEALRREAAKSDPEAKPEA
jgi:phosphatidylglycerol:prolipoprotein diacylglycerol transferase